jgi:mannose-6-phosphate isomerase-like protein (cupin superfamily)
MTGSYTHAHLTDVEDVAPALGADGFQETRFAQEALASPRIGVSHYRIRPAARQGFAHRHDEAEEVYVVLAGSGRVKLDNDVIELARLDALRVDPPVLRSFEAGPEGLELLVFGPHHPNDGELVPGWWATEDG